MAQTCGIDPEDLRVRPGEYPANEHPLETAWTFWFDKKTSDRKESDQYMEGLRQLGSFNTVEGFYRHYTHLLRPSELPRDHNCYMFRKNYKPMWEEFPEGGCWIIRIKRKASQNYVNHMWENLLLACIGEAFEMPDVVGCVLSTRIKDDVLSIWNLTNRDTPARFRIGERLKEVLDLNMTALIQYKDHMQSLQDYSTYRNARNYMFAPSPNVTPMQHVLDTPIYGAHGTPDHTFLEHENLLPPAMVDDMLPPAAVDSEGFGGGWPASGLVSGSGGESRSPGLVAGKSPSLGAQAPPVLAAAARSAGLSADAPPWTGPMGGGSSSVAAADPTPVSVAATASSTPPVAAEMPTDSAPASVPASPPAFQQPQQQPQKAAAPATKPGPGTVAAAVAAWPAASAAAKAAMIPAAAPTVPASGPTAVASPPISATMPTATAPTIVAQAAAAAAAAAASPVAPAAMMTQTSTPTSTVTRVVQQAAVPKAVAKSPIPSPKPTATAVSGSPIPSPKTSVVVVQPGSPMVATTSNTVVVASPPKAVVGTPPLQPAGAPATTVSAPMSWAAKMAAQQNRGPPAKGVPKVVVVTPVGKMAPSKSFGRPTGPPMVRQAAPTPKPKGV